MKGLGEVKKVLDMKIKREAKVVNACLKRHLKKVLKMFWIDVNTKSVSVPLAQHVQLSALKSVCVSCPIY